jgi:RNA polymerase sigma-70 factor (ECF subfamily)
VRAWALRRTRDPARSADLAQEVTMIVLENLREGRIEDPAKLASFMVGVARNLLSTGRRDERRRHALLEQFGPTFADVARMDESSVDRLKIDDCFAKLDYRAKAVLLLTFYADRSADEIAEELAVAAGNVRVMRHRALSRLHACIEGAS